MMHFIPPRWRKPAGTVLAGTMFAAAWAIRGGHYWWVWVTLAEVGALGRAFSLYLWAGEDDDLGAIAGSRADERQKQFSQWSWALSGKVTMLAAFTGLVVGIAVKANWWWSFLAVLAVTGLTYLLGLSSSGIAQEDPADNADSGHRARTPASS